MELVSEFVLVFLEVVLGITTNTATGVRMAGGSFLVLIDAQGDIQDDSEIIECIDCARVS